MTLTGKDGVATALVAAGGGLYIGYEAGATLPGLGAPRALSTAVLVLGIAACAAAGGAPGTSARWQMFVGWLGMAAFVTGIAGLLSGSVLMLRVVTGLVVGIWLIATVRRLFRPVREEAVSAPPERELVGGRR